MEIDERDIDECNVVGWSGDWLRQLDSRLRPTDYSLRLRMKETIDMISEPMDSPLSILDLGCGIGIFPLNIAKKYRNASVTGIDISSRHIEIASGLAQKAKLSDRVKFMVGDIRATLPRGPFDYVVCAEVLEHLLDPRAALANIYQICGPTTCLIVSVPHLYGSRKGQEGIFYRQVSDVDFSTIVHTQDRQLLDPNRKTYKYYHKQYSFEEISKLLNDQGFSVISYQGIKIQMRYVKTAMGILGISKPVRNLDGLLNKYTGNRYAGNFILKCKKTGRGSTADMKQLKVGLLQWTVSKMDVNRLGGMEVGGLNELKRLNDEPEVCATLFAKDIVGDIPNTRAIRHIDFLIKYDIFYYLQFLRENRDSDILHGHNTPFLAIFVPRCTLIHFHNIPFLPLYRVFKNRYQKAHFAFCSRFLYQKFIEKYSFIPLRNCFVLHNAVDTEKFTPRQAVRSKVEIDRKKRIFFMGQWSEEKGFYFLLEVIKQLERKRNDFEVYLVGSPHFWAHSKKRKEEQGEDTASGLLSPLKSVHSLGIVRHADIPATLREMDILVVPSLWEEPFGLVNIEAMAAGLPVVACRVGGIPEIVEHGREGFLVEPGNVHEMIKYIEVLLDDDEMRITMGKNGREKVEQRFTWDSHMRRLFEIYGSILGKK